MAHFTCPVTLAGHELTVALIGGYKYYINCSYIN